MPRNVNFKLISFRDTTILIFNQMVKHSGMSKSDFLLELMEAYREKRGFIATQLKDSPIIVKEYKKPLVK